MGLAGAIIGTLGMAFMQGYSQKQQADAAARQAEANAAVAKQNAATLDAQAKEQDKVNKINEENRQRQLNAKLAEQATRISASGIDASTGSALQAQKDSAQNMSFDMATEAYNNRQKVDSIFNDSTNMTNQQFQYERQARNYRAAGRQAMTNALIGGVFSLAGSLYQPTSAAAQGIGGGSGSVTTPAASIGNNTNVSWASGNGFSFSRQYDYKSGFSLI